MVNSNQAVPKDYLIYQQILIVLYSISAIYNDYFCVCGDK